VEAKRYYYVENDLVEKSGGDEEEV